MCVAVCDAHEDAVKSAVQRVRGVGAPDLARVPFLSRVLSRVLLSYGAVTGACCENSVQELSGGMICLGLSRVLSRELSTHKLFWGLFRLMLRVLSMPSFFFKGS